MEKINQLFLGAVACLLLAACASGGGGGGRGSTSAVPNAVVEGAWSGTSSAGYALNALSLEDGSSYVLFGNTTGSTHTIVGFDQGTVSIQGNAISASVHEYFYTGAVFTGTLTGTAITGASIEGTATYSSGATTTFSLTPMSTSNYNYHTQAQLSDVAGSWTGSVWGVAPATVSVNGSTGAISGLNGACAFSGTATPRPTGKNVFNIRLTLGAVGCHLPGGTLTGIAITYPIADTGLKQLLVAVQDDSKAIGTLFLAQR